MANTLTVQEVQTNERGKTVICKLALTGSYVQVVRGANTGEVLLPNSASNNTQKPDPFWGLKGPTRAYMINGPAGFGAEILPGADAFHWLLKIYGTTPGTELAAGAYPAGLSGDLDAQVAFEGDAIA